MRDVVTMQRHLSLAGRIPSLIPAASNLEHRYVVIYEAMASFLQCKYYIFFPQVVFFMYLWSIDIEAVLTAMSCFRLLCEEADIRCGTDEMAVTQILPNYNVYAELASASRVLTTGRWLCVEIIYSVNPIGCTKFQNLSVYGRLTVVFAQFVEARC